MDVIIGVLIVLLGLALAVFSKRIAEWQTKLFPKNLASLEPLGCLFNVIVGVAWIVLGIDLIFNK